MPQETGQEVGAGDWLVTQYLDEPAGTLSRTMPRSAVNSAALGALTSGTLYACRLLLPIGVNIKNVSVLSNTTAEATGTHCWAGIADQNMTLQGVSADNTGAAFFAASTLQAFALAVPYVTTYSGYFYVVFNATATTPPTLSGNTPPAGIASVAPIVCGTSNTGLTTPTAVGTALTALTAGLVQFYATVS